MRSHLTIALTMMAAFGAATYAGLTMPDTVLFGTVMIDGELVTASDDVTLIARVDGNGAIVGRYTMGARAILGNRYALRVRMDSGADGSMQTANVARLGNIVRVLVTRDGGSEESAAEIMLAETGQVKELSLSHTSGTVLGDMDEDLDVDLLDHGEFEPCLGGPGNATGMGCDPGDFDQDHDIDMFDWRGFQNAVQSTP